MVPHFGNETRKYYVLDYCQLATKNVLSEYWSKIPFFDGDEKISTEEYLTKNYVRKIKKDLSSWEKCQHNHFCYKGFFEDFKIEWSELARYQSYRDNYLYVKKLHSIPYEQFLKEFIRKN